MDDTTPTRRTWRCFWCGGSCAENADARRRSEQHESWCPVLYDGRGSDDARGAER